MASYISYENGGSAVGMAPNPRLPDINWKKPSSPVASLSDLNAVARSPQETQAQVLGENAPLRVGYGEHPLGAQVPTVLTWQNNLIMLLVWEEGPIEQIVSVKVNGETPPAGIVFTHYLGTAGQTADPTMVAAFAAQGIIYADALPGIAYSVAKIPPDVTSGYPNFVALIKGRLLYDARLDSTAGGTGTHRANDSSTWAYSTNPALALGDFEASTLYGQGRTVNAASLIVSADFDDEMVGTEKRRVIGLVIDAVNTCDLWQEALRTYAGCFVSQEGDECVLVPDKPGSVEFSFTAANVEKITRMIKRGVRQVPTVMEVRYTDTSVWPWAEKTATAYAAGVLAGTTPRRVSRVSLLGVPSYSQAMREAVERLNKLMLSDLYLEFDAFDECLLLRMGSIVDITHPRGLTAKQLRIMNIQNTRPGRWSISALEYDPAAYSDLVSSAPTYTDTTLPSPSAPPAVTGLTMTEEVFQLENGTYSSRWRITWASATYPYLSHYRAELWDGTTLIHSASPESAEWSTPAIQEGINYTAKVVSISATGSTGTWSTQSALAAGKSLIPGNVPSVSAFEAGGRVYLSWEPAVDVDISLYEVRYGAAAVAWESTVFIDRLDALRLTYDQLPAGTWTIHVKAIDSAIKPGKTVGQYSATAATVAVVVTSDTNSFLIDTKHQTAPTLTNMESYTIHATDPNVYYVTSDGAMAATTFPAQADTYTGIAATYHASVTSTWLGESEDFGIDLGGQWTGTATVADLSGSHISYLGTAMAAAPSTWSYASGLSQKLNARFARLKHEALTTSTLKVTVPTQSIRVDAVPREEVGTGTSSAAGATTITLSNEYVAVKKITITPEGTTARSATYDNIVLGSPTTFDVYVFDDTGVKIASPFRYQFQGV